MKHDLSLYPYPSQRNVVCASAGMVATSHPLAAQAGLDILKKGGNAVDAAIATATTLTVVEPTSNGIGGDLFALVHTKDKLYGINGSGFSPQALSRELLFKKGLTEIPPYGWIPVTVPGAPKAWAQLSKRFGILDFAAVLEPAIRYARNGFVIQPTVGDCWNMAFHRYKQKLTLPLFQSWFETFAPCGRAPKIGEMFRSEHHARSLEKIAATQSQDFYQGTIADAIIDFSDRSGGLLSKKDLSDFDTLWVEPVCSTYKGYEIWEIPPNGHGITALMALNIIADDSFPLADSFETLHVQIEAMKRAFADSRKYVADPEYMTVSINQLLDRTNAKKWRAQINDTAQNFTHTDFYTGGTVYCATADKDGMMVSLIQSNYMGFGSGLVVPETGIALHNRGHNFTLEENHPNCIGPRKRPYHTIIPGFITRNGEAVGPFGVMGGFMQPQGHLQVAMNLIDFNMNPQQALDRPRWMWENNLLVHCEQGFPSSLLRQLSRAGHQISIPADPYLFGRGQIILRNEYGALIGGTEKRADGYIACY
ncbi:MAG: gamma-glutamyltransferase family protein [Chitinivibrionales bacterium]|nr:gamma-glutamyltransferase family protein [Chitinivibrionales bacterium]